MARPDMTKTIGETFEKVPSPQGRRPAPTRKEIEALMDRDDLTDEERELVGNHLLGGGQRMSAVGDAGKAPSEPAGVRKIPGQQTMAPGPGETGKESSRDASDPPWQSDPVEVLTRFGEEVADLPAELYQSNLERKGAEERRLAEVKSQRKSALITGMKRDRMVPNKPTKEDFQQIRDINAEIEKLQARLLTIPGGRQLPDDMERGSDMSYGDMLLRN